jgi:hypothetical protein
MAITDIQRNFFVVIKNCHRDDPPWKVLTYICEPIYAEVVRKDIKFVDYDPLNTHKDIYEIWKDDQLWLRGNYETLLTNLFEHIFDIPT